MPGHIIQSKCGCGYEGEYLPGYSEMTRKLMVMAYCGDFSEIGTFSAMDVEVNNLSVVRDPFIMSNEEDDFIEALDPENISEVEIQRLRKIVTKNWRQSDGIHNLFLCPKCKNVTLFMKLIVHWD